MPASATPSRALIVLLWTLRALTAALFFLTSFMKLSGSPSAIDVFAAIGWGDWFRVFTGAVEFAGAVGILIPSASGLAALLLLGVAAGAFVAQVSVLHEDWIHTIVIAAVQLCLIYLQRSSIQAWLGR